MAKWNDDIQVTAGDASPMTIEGTNPNPDEYTIVMSKEQVEIFVRAEIQKAITQFGKEMQKQFKGIFRAS